MSIEKLMQAISLFRLCMERHVLYVVHESHQKVIGNQKRNTVRPCSTLLRLTLLQYYVILLGIPLNTVRHRSTLLHLIAVSILRDRIGIPLNHTL